MPKMPDGTYQYGDTTIQKSTDNGVPVFTGIAPPPAQTTPQGSSLPDTSALRQQFNQSVQNYQTMAAQIPEGVRSTIQQYMPDYRNPPQPSMFSPATYWNDRNQEAQQLRSMIQHGLTTNIPGQRLTADGLSALLGRLSELDRGTIDVNREWMGQTGALSRTAMQDQGSLVRTLADRQLSEYGAGARTALQGESNLLGQEYGAMLNAANGTDDLQRAQAQYYQSQAQARRPSLFIPPPTDPLGNPLPPTDPQARKANVANSALLEAFTRSQGDATKAASLLATEAAKNALALDALSRAANPKDPNESKFLEALRERNEVANLALGQLASMYGPEILSAAQVDQNQVRNDAVKSIYGLMGYGQGRLSADTLNKLNQALGQAPKGYADGGVVTPPMSALGLPNAPTPGAPPPVNLDVIQRYQQYVALAQKMGLPPVPLQQFMTSTAAGGAQAMSGAQPTPPMPQMQPQAGAAVPGNPVTSALQRFADGGLVGGPQLDGKLVVDPNPMSGRDSIPAMIDGMHPARLDSGEMVIPRDVVMYYGTQKLQQMIDKARGAGNGGQQQ